MLIHELPNAKKADEMNQYSVIKSEDQTYFSDFSLLLTGITGDDTEGELGLYLT